MVGRHSLKEFRPLQEQQSAVSNKPTGSSALPLLVLLGCVSRSRSCKLKARRTFLALQAKVKDVGLYGVRGRATLSCVSRRAGERYPQCG